MICQKKKALSLMELIIITVIIAILGAIAVARVINLADAARKVTEEANVNFINSGLKTYYVESHLNKRTPLYPESLDNALDGTYSSKDNPFYTTVLRDPGLQFTGWQKIDSNNYLGPGGESYIYDNNEGSFYK